MNVDLTSGPRAMALRLALQLGNARVVALHAPAGGEWGALYRDDETWVDVAESDTLLAMRRRSGECNLKFAARIALKFAA